MPTTILRAVDEYPHISHATYVFMRDEITRLHAAIARLEQERAQLRRDLAVQEQQTNHWYMKATYTPAELQVMYTRRSRGKNEFTGAWLTPDEHAAYTALEQLHERGNITIHATDAEAWTAISTDVVRKAEAGATVAVAVTSNDAATQLNAVAQDARACAGHTRTPAVAVAGSDGLNIRIGDRIMTRRNDKDLGVANRDTWTVARVHRDGSVSVKDKGSGRKVRLTAEYVEAHTHIAYASTEYGVQGATVDFGHGIVTDSSSAQAVYVSATRGREHNTLHLVASDVDEARSIFTDALRRESGDSGVEAARENISRDLHGVVLPASGVDLKVRAERLATNERVYAARVREWELATANWEKRHPGISATDPATGVAALEREHQTAIADVARLERDKSAAVVDAHTTGWEHDYAAVEQARVAAVDAPLFRRRSAQEAHEKARRDFTAKHGHEPTPQPPEQLRDTWRRTSAAPGRDERLEAARRHVDESRKKLEQLRRDPAPQRPTAPTVGTPAQEIAKDVRYLQTRQQLEQRPAMRRAEPRTSQISTPGLER